MCVSISTRQPSLTSLGLVVVTVIAAENEQIYQRLTTQQRLVRVKIIAKHSLGQYYSCESDMSFGLTSLSAKRQRL